MAEQRVVVTAYGDKHRYLLDRCKASLPTGIIHDTQFDWWNGKAWAMNKILHRLNDTDIVFMLDADDVASEDWFSQDRLRLLNEFDLIYGDCYLTDGFNKTMFKSRPFDVELLKCENYIPYSTVITKGWVLKKVGYDETEHVGDWLTWHKILQFTDKFVYCPGICCVRDVSTSYFDTGNKYSVWLKRKIRNYYAKRKIKEIWNSHR